jgi:hypothetical protein
VNTADGSAGEAIDAARGARARRDLGDLDFLRALIAARAAGASERDIARGLGIPQPSVAGLLASADRRAAAPIPPGFSGASPYEIAQRFAAGYIDRGRAAEELCRWSYAPDTARAAAEAEPDPTPYPAPAGSFYEIRRSFSEGLIDGRMYEAILDAQAGRPAPRR